MRCRALFILMIAPLLGATLGGCQASAPGSTSLRIAPGAYTATFQAFKDELRADGFELDRIDARAGVITTRPHFSAGLATPWIGDESTIEQEFEGLLNRQQRRVVVKFTPIGNGAESEAEDLAIDLRDSVARDRDIRAQVVVHVERIHRVGLRPSSASVRLSSVARHGQDHDPDEPLWTTTVVEQDDLLAARIIRGVTDRAHR